MQRRLLHASTSLLGLDEGRRAIQEAVGATAPGLSPFKQPLVKYGGTDTITTVMQLRDEALQAQEAQRSARASQVLPDGDDAVLPPNESMGSPGSRSFLPTMSSPLAGSSSSAQGGKLKGCVMTVLCCLLSVAGC